MRAPRQLFSQIEEVVSHAANHTDAFARRIIASHPRTHLEKAGYRSISATESRLALPLAGQFHPLIAIVDHTFSPNEQQAFVENLHEAHPGIFVLIVRFGLLHATQLLEECGCCLSNQPGGPRVRILQPDFTVSLRDVHISEVFSKVS